MLKILLKSLYLVTFLKKMYFVFMLNKVNK